MVWFQPASSREKGGTHDPWYLVYRHVNEMETGTFRDGVEEVAIPLASATEGEAVAEAKAKWEEIRSQNAKHPPVFCTLPKPRVIYQISI